MIRMSSLLPIFSSNPFNDDEIFVWSANIVDSNMNVPCAKLLDILFNSSISLSSRMIAVAPNYAYIYAMLRPTGVRAPVIIMCFPINCDGIHLRLLTVSLSILYMYSAICYQYLYETISTIWVCYIYIGSGSTSSGLFFTSIESTFCAILFIDPDKYWAEQYKSQTIKNPLKILYFRRNGKIPTFGNILMKSIVSKSAVH